MSRSGYKALIVVVAAAMLVLGCVAPRENAAEIIPDVPSDLLDPTTSTTELPVDEIEGRIFELQLYFLSEIDDSLWQVTRPREQVPRIQDALDALVAGPLDAETELFSLRARLSESLNPVAGQPTGGLLSITVSDEAQFRDNPDNRLATQVLVCTMTQFDTVNAIELRDTSGPIPLAGIDSESIGEQATRSSYGDCVAENIADIVPDGAAEDGGEDGATEDGAVDEEGATDQ